MAGRRLAELAMTKLGWLQLEHLDDVHGDELAWAVMAPGKRNKWPEVSLPDPAMDALQTCLVQCGLDSGPLVSNPELPYVGRLDGQGGLWAELSYAVLCDGSERCAAAVKATNERAAGRIRQGCPGAPGRRCGNQVSTPPVEVRPCPQQRSQHGQSHPSTPPSSRRSQCPAGIEWWPGHGRPR